VTETPAAVPTAMPLRITRRAPDGTVVDSIDLSVPRVKRPEADVHLTFLLALSAAFGVGEWVVPAVPVSTTLPGGG
jgi:hypothetical protein